MAVWVLFITVSLISCFLVSIWLYGIIYTMYIGVVSQNYTIYSISAVYDCIYKSIYSLF